MQDECEQQDRGDGDGSHGNHCLPARALLASLGVGVQVLAPERGGLVLAGTGAVDRGHHRRGVGGGRALHEGRRVGAHLRGHVRSGRGGCRGLGGGGRGGGLARSCEAGIADLVADLPLAGVDDVLIYLGGKGGDAGAEGRAQQAAHDADLRGERHRRGGRKGGGDDLRHGEVLEDLAALVGRRLGGGGCGRSGGLGGAHLRGDVGLQGLLDAVIRSYVLGRVRILGHASPLVS